MFNVFLCVSLAVSHVFRALMHSPGEVEERHVVTLHKCKIYCKVKSNAKCRPCSNIFFQFSVKSNRPVRMCRIINTRVSDGFVLSQTSP